MSNEVVYKVSQVSDYIKKIFDAESNLKFISMYGEVSGVSCSGGNIYFNLKDENALLPCVAFGTKFLEIIKNGEQLIVNGTVRFYAKGGKISVTVINCKPYGVGALYQQFIELKNNLEKEGLFDVSHKKQIPKLVKRMGVVTSSTGAVIRDIINVTTRRNDGVDIVVYPVKVQGVGASEQIADGINFFSNYENVDIVIVARGGGSFEDLMPFNTEIVARATYNCNKPIISAVGHETDFTIIDFVADLRAPTPSAAAELAVIDRNGEMQRYKYTLDRIYNNINQKISKDVELINKDIKRFVDYFDTKIKLLDTSLKTNYKLITVGINSMIVDLANNLIASEKLLNAYNPSNILKKGYAVIESNGKIVSSVEVLECGQNVDIYMANGKLSANILNKESKNG
ncbi:MAG: exodeoxyribonuclease VII large subunit [Christensenellales bacterium]